MSTRRRSPSEDNSPSMVVWLLSLAFTVILITVMEDIINPLGVFAKLLLAAVILLLMLLIYSRRR